MSPSTLAAARPTVPASPVAIHDLLFATDLSSDSVRAFEHARLIAERFHAEVTVYHAIEVLEERYPSLRSERARGLWEETEWAARAVLREQASILTAPHTVKVERVPSMRHGVIEMIRGRRPDLVVMATHHHTGLGHLFGASMTEEVAVARRSPVLAVRSLGGLPYRRIVVPTDFSLASRLAFPMAALLATAFEAEIIAVHVAPPGTAPIGGAPDGHPRFRGEAFLWEFLRPDFEPLPVTAQVHTGTVWERIVHAAAVEAADLIVMATRGHDSVADRILGSNTERVLRHAPCSVLIA